MTCHESSFISSSSGFAVNTWLKSKKKTHLGLPLFIGTGSFDYEGVKYRFMVMDRFSTDLEKICIQNDKTLPEKTVFSLGLRIVRRFFGHNPSWVFLNLMLASFWNKRRSVKMWKM